jgi:dUTPase
MVTIKVREIKSAPGFGGSTPQGTVTVSAIIQSDELGRLEIGVQVLNQGNEKLNVQEAHAVLQRFSQEFSKALMQPLAFD